MIDAKVAGIDLSRIEQEVAEHAELYEEYATQLAEAKSAADKAKDALAVAEAEAELDVRDNPKRYKLGDPVREGMVKMKVALHAKVRKRQEILHRRKYEAGILEAKVNSLEHRKRMLEKAVDLLLAGMFAKPKIKDREGMENHRAKKVAAKTAYVIE